MDPVLISPFFIDYVLPLILVFTLIFAILEKTKLLGDDKKQINALIGLVVGLILIAFPFARDIVVLLMPFLAVSAVILLVFMLLYGFIVGKKDGDVLDRGWKIAFGAILAIALATFVLIILGWWTPIYDFVVNRGSGQIWMNALLILIIAGAIIAVLKGSSSKDS